MRDIEQEIKETAATMAMEGMPLNDSNKSRLHDILSGKSSIETVVKQLVEKHKRTGKEDHEQA